MCNGLLIINAHLSKHALFGCLKEASKYVSNNLYIEFNANGAPIHLSNQLKLINYIYGRPYNICSNLNVKVLLPSVTKRNLVQLSIFLIGNSLIKYRLNFEKTISAKYALDNSLIHYVNDNEACVGDISNADNAANTPNDDILANVEYAAGHQDLNNKILLTNTQIIANDSTEDFETVQVNDINTYDGVVIGGTFDHMHDGHKLLISTALLHANKLLVVGVGDGPLLKNKVLRELMEPVKIRIENVVSFIEAVKPDIKHLVIPLFDTCGPSATHPNLQALVVSDETKSGGTIVNEKRKNNGLNSLDVLSINLVGENSTDLPASLNAEGKLSSSAQRMRKLGVLLRPPNFVFDNQLNCYVIGITGGIASGKSSIVKRLQLLGAHTINCDKLGHNAYMPGQPAYISIIKHFGQVILNEDKTINRKELGRIVFSDSHLLQLLNTIVWPEIKKMLNNIILEQHNNYDVIVYEGAVLFEAGWDTLADEVWCCILPYDEAARRIQIRDSLTLDQANNRIYSQISNEVRLQKSHVVLSTFWEEDFTQKLCEKAWSLLRGRLKKSTTASL